MEKILNQVLTLICNKSQFSFEIDQNCALKIDYNNGTGTAKLMLDKSMEGARNFINAIVAHKNKIAGKIAPVVFDTIPEPVENFEFAPLFKLTKNKVYFNARSSKLCDPKNLDLTKPNVTFGYEVITDHLPDHLILWHPGTGFDISIVYKGVLFGTRLYTGKAAEIITAFINEATGHGAAMIKELEAAFNED